METTVDGVSIYYEQYGNTGDQVLLLHGWQCDTSLFLPVAKALSENMRVTAIDFPGHGKSGRPPEPWGVPEYSEAVVKLIDKLNLSPCHIVAHSFGGRVALYLSSKYPQIVRKMVITGGAGIKPPETEVSKKRSERYRRLRKQYEWMQKTKVFGSLPDLLLDALRKKYGSRDYNALDEEMRKTFVKVINLDLRPMLPKIKAPTLLVCGSNDTETPIWMGETMAAEIPDAALITFEGASHYAYLEKWQRFYKIVLHFFTEE